MVARPPRYEDLSPDLQHQIWRNQVIRSQLEWLLLVPFLLYLLVPNFNRWADQYIGVKRQVQVEDNREPQPVDTNNEEFRQTLKKGDVVAGFPVTSPFGDRSDRAHALPAGASLWHYGVDFGTPKGTKIYAIGKQVSVECPPYDKRGGGNYAIVKSSDAPQYQFKLLHLDECYPGEFTNGDVIALTGDTGIGAAHLDVRQQRIADGTYLDPYKGFMEWFLTGTNPETDFNENSFQAMASELKASGNLYLEAYEGPDGTWRIGFGASEYPDGSKVRRGDLITEEEAVELLRFQQEGEATYLPVYFDIHNADPSDEITAIFHASLNLGIRDPHQIAYILATARHESATFSTLQEMGGCSYFAQYVGILGNATVEDACRYSGKGLVQLTGRNNFARISEIYGVDALNDPDVVKRPDLAATILVEGMMNGTFTGLALPEFVGGEKVDYVGARRTVNGTDRDEHIASIARGFEGQVRDWMLDYGLVPAN